ncbi:hypothetical protein M9458_023353, partial [Cirrhinus mrigala]
RCLRAVSCPRHGVQDSWYRAWLAQDDSRSPGAPAVSCFTHSGQQMFQYAQAAISRSTSFDKKYQDGS